MDLLTCIAGVLGQKSHQGDLDRLAGQVQTDPTDHDAARIFHDALRDYPSATPIEPGWGTHPRSWPGMHGADQESHPLHAAYNAALEHSFRVHYEPIHQDIENHPDDPDRHFMAANIAMLFDKPQLAVSHQYAMEADLRPWASSGRYWSRVRPGQFALATNFDGNSNLSQLAHPLYEQMPGRRSGHSQHYRWYPTQRAAWDAFHEGHRRWQESLQQDS